MDKEVQLAITVYDFWFNTILSVERKNRDIGGLHKAIKHIQMALTKQEFYM